MTPLWSPSRLQIEDSNLSRYRLWLAGHGHSFDDYQSLWKWSTQQPAEFWESLLKYFEIRYEGSYTRVLSGDNMPGVKWFEGLRLNYAEHVFRNDTDTRPAIIFKSESGSIQTLSWAELRREVGALQRTLMSLGVEAGDCVAAFLPTIPEATIGFLAANSIGAIWSSCSPDFGAQSVIDRFAQTRPKVLLATGTYSYGGKVYNKSMVVKEVVSQLPDLRKVIWVGDTPEAGDRSMSWRDATTATGEIQFHRMPFDHPVWVLYSSGTTGLPKAITHSQGGILLEHLKYLTFHNDVKAGDNCFWYTTTGWMMWNYVQSNLLCGATLVLYDGSPAYPDQTTLWRFVQDAKITHFGTSAGFILANRKEGLHPGSDFDLRSLRSIGSTGSTLPPEGFDWIYRNVSHDVWLASMSGGTDVCSAFVGGNPTWPVYAGEIQCRALGCKVEAYNESGQPVMDEVGEMVITVPMPSMPVFFWNDVDFRRYRESYFEMFPSVWRHGDWIRITPRQGVVIYGRSDATLNRGGVRIGTSEVYRAVDKIAEVRDSLIVCVERDKGEFFMPLFVQLQPGLVLTEELIQRINRTIRNDYSPRHVPDTIVAVPEIPYTMSGKKTETPVKKILMGKKRSEVVSEGALRNPGAIDFFVEYVNKTGHN